MTAHPAGSLVLTRLPGRATAPDAAQVMRLFPPRPAGSAWPATRHSREHVLTRLLAPPFALDNPAGQAQRRRGLTRMLGWLGSLPGQTWQDRWIVSGAEDCSSWRDLPDRWLAGAGRAGSRPGYGLGAGLLLLICGDVIRPGVPWLLASGSLQSMAAARGRVRDPDAFAGLRRLCQTEQASPVTRDLSLRRIAIIMAAKGGRVGDITAGDCVELCRLADAIGGSRSRGMYFYQLLRGTGVFPAGAPATSRMFITQGQLSPAQMLSRYAIACRPVHDLIVDYLREQQLTVDHATLAEHGARPGQAVLARPRAPPSRDRLAAAGTGGGHRLETADPGEDQQVSDRSRGHHRDQRAPHGCGRRVVHSPGVLP